MSPPAIEQYLAPLPHSITLSCRAAGRRGRPVLMFLHGFPEAAFAWDELLAHFARPEHGGYRCIAPNLRGYASSSSPPELAAYHAKPLAQDIAALIGVECGPAGQLAALVAHDWGGALAWNLAATRPELMQRLVIINSPHPQTFLRGLKHSPAQQAASAYMNFLIRPDAEALLAADDFARLWPFFERMGGAGWLTADLRAQYRAVWRGDGSRPGAGLTGGLNYYRASPLRPAHENDPAAAAIELPADAFAVALPTLVLWAMQDTALLPELLVDLERWVPRLQLERIEDATHWVVHEQPELVAARIGRFLRS